jgi:hypothetical protein
MKTTANEEQAMRLEFPDGRFMWVGKRTNGGIALQQGSSYVLLSDDELPMVLDAIAAVMKL